MAESTYAQRCHAEYCAEHPSYFGCVRKDLPGLVDKARKEARQILEDLFCFYRGDITIEIGAAEHGLTWSVTGALKVNGKPVRKEDPCDLLFLELNNLILQAMIDRGMVGAKKKIN